MHRRSFLAAVAAATVGTSQTQNAAVPNRPHVPGTLSLRARKRSEQSSADKKTGISENVLRWEVSETAIIICDMWNAHHCGMSAQRVAAMAPRMNQVVNAARSLGVMIIHAPSDTMKFYEGTPQRLRMQQAPKVSTGKPIVACPRDSTEAESFPIDDRSNVCDDPVVKKWSGPGWPWTREHPAIDVVGYDGVSADGQEIYNFCKQEGITNIALMGVHTNVCILNRGFGLRSLTQLGFKTVLV